MIEADSTVYWRRRAVAGIGVVGVVLLVAWAMSGSSGTQASQAKMPQAINAGSTQVTFQPPPGSNAAQVSNMPSSLLPLPNALGAGANSNGGDPSAAPSAQALAPGSTLPGSPGYPASDATQPGATPQLNGAPSLGSPSTAAPGALPATPNLNSTQAPVPNSLGAANSLPNSNNTLPNSNNTLPNSNNSVPADPGATGAVSPPGMTLPNNSSGVPHQAPLNHRPAHGSGDNPQTTSGQSGQPGTDADQDSSNQTAGKPGKSGKPNSLAGNGGQHGMSTTGHSIRPATPAATPACADDNIGLVAQVSAASFKGGQHPVFRLVVANLSGVACTRDLNRGLRELQVTNSSGARVWDSNDCPTVRTTAAQVQVLEPGKPLTFPLTWAGRTSAPGCSAANKRADLPAGSYQLTGKLGKLTSGAAQFSMAK